MKLSARTLTAAYLLGLPATAGAQTTTLTDPDAASFATLDVRDPLIKTRALTGGQTEAPTTTEGVP